MLAKAPLIGFLLMTSGCSPVEVAPFSQLDEDDNGRISEQEAARDTALNEAFHELDVDRNGELTPREYLAATGATGGR